MFGVGKNAEDVVARSLERLCKIRLNEIQFGSVLATAKIRPPKNSDTMFFSVFFDMGVELIRENPHDTIALL